MKAQTAMVISGRTNFKVRNFMRWTRALHDDKEVNCPRKYNDT